MAGFDYVNTKEVSVTQKLNLPVLTTTQRNALTTTNKGDLIYNSTTNTIQIYNASWGEVSGAGGISNIVEDTTPQLGGDLDCQNNDIQNIQLAEFNGEFDNGNSSTADTIDWGAGNMQKSTMTGNCTYTFTAPSGVSRVQLKLIQDGTGSRIATWPGSVKWPGGTAPTLTTTASGVDIITFYYDGTNYYGVESLDFS